VVERRARDVAAAGRTMLLSAVIIAISLGTPVVFRDGSGSGVSSARYRMGRMSGSMGGSGRRRP
jgi:hypothetical protein